MATAASLKYQLLKRPAVKSMIGSLRSWPRTNYFAHSIFLKLVVKPRPLLSAGLHTRIAFLITPQEAQFHGYDVC